ncbi:chloramphenicol phosphotransferase CPT [Hamadaea tsunoensis]|uniref:chloramphenicol phosphotransferase CPT n=1 Tax=Hamadaea tsunoensis TaxID=53368 RepID=UPI001B7F8300|nr:chloramphenicol phosphotransferase CPT [Hamadaea tsunoensis]
MTTRVVVLNGGSSAGKSAIARRLQDVLPEPWLSLSVDTLVDAMPAALRTAESGIMFAADGGVHVGDRFRELEAAWMAGVATMARAGAGIIIDDVFLGGSASQQRWRDALAGLDVLWAGVRCDAEVAAAREAARGDRTAGMAAAQADLVHEGVRYDVTVDTTYVDPLSCARVIAAAVR